MKAHDERRISRRSFIRAATTSAALLPLAGLGRTRAQQPGRDRPNILWLVSEDNSPYLGCYGDELARTPHLDELARKGVRFENAHSGAPVCAPARCTLITGMEPTAMLGSLHMRSSGRMPPGTHAFTWYLRQAGYYCINNGKEDYNIHVPDEAWDQSSNWRKKNNPHWRDRPEGAPFFAQFNCSITHEGRLFPERFQPGQNPTDPADVTLPAYHPDTDNFRRDRANYYDLMHRMDAWMGRKLAELERDGLAEDTIVFYFGDHGGVLPRSKRFVYNSGTRVPLIVRFPEKYRHLAPAEPGGSVTAPVSFADFGPTALNLAGVPVPEHMHGVPFAGPDPVQRDYVYCYRGRMDERYDMVRAVKDERYTYIRNYMPHLPRGQHIHYMFRMPSMQEWKDLYDAGKLEPPQTYFWEPRPAEELYDIREDPDEVNNLAQDPGQREVLEAMRAANLAHMKEIRDVGFIPEDGVRQFSWEPWTWERTRDPEDYGLDRLIEAADVICDRDEKNLDQLAEWLRNEDELVRYWAAVGAVMLGEQARRLEPELLLVRGDGYHPARVPAAEALVRAGRASLGRPSGLEALRNLVGTKNQHQLAAANALEHLGERARPALPAMRQALAADDADRYVVRALTHTVGKLTAAAD